MTCPVAVLGAGSWGTALAIHLGRIGVGARLWGRDPALVKEINDTRENSRYLAGIAVPVQVRATDDAEDTLAGAGLVLVAVPSRFVEAVLGAMKGAIPPGAVLCSATKGLEPNGARRIPFSWATCCLATRWRCSRGHPSRARWHSAGRPRS
jgi:glycerol-3-phosphate dehydrogenase (NAD(P)+)